MTPELGRNVMCDGRDEAVRAEARQLAAAVDGDGRVGSFVRALLDDLARGEALVVVRFDEEVTPAQAARLLGVTRQYVDRLCEQGRLPFRRLPGSRHRRIRLRDVAALVDDRWVAGLNDAHGSAERDGKKVAPVNGRSAHWTPGGQGTAARPTLTGPDDVDVIDLTDAGQAEPARPGRARVETAAD